MKKLIIFMLLISFQISYAKWEAVNNGPNNEPLPGGTSSLAIFHNQILAGFCGEGSLYISSNMGENWRETGFFKNTCIIHIFVFNDNIFVFEHVGPIRYSISKDGGETWKEITNGLYNGVYTEKCVALGNSIFIATNHGIFMTTNMGDNWVAMNNGFPTNENGGPPWVRGLNTKNGNIYAGTLGYGLFMSSDTGKHWINIALDPDLLFISNILFNDENMFISTGYGEVYLSSDMGNTWVNRSNGLPLTQIYDLAMKDNYLFAGTAAVKGDLYLTTDMGINWNRLDFGDLKRSSVMTIEFLGEYVFVGTISQGIYRAKLSDLVSDVKDNSSNTADIDFYPNPASDYIYVDIPDDFAPVKSIEIYDQVGRLLKKVPRNSLATNSISIYVGDLAPSIYFLKIQTNDSYFFKKIIKI